MLRELEAIDTSPIEELQAIKSEQLTLQDRLERMKAMENQVSTEVYTRVRNDYEARFLALERQARPLLDKARQEYARLKGVMTELEKRLHSAQLAKEEVEFRNALGEYTETQFAELLAQTEGEVKEVEAHILDAGALRERFLSAVLSEAELEGGAPPQATVPPSAGVPAAVPEVTAPLPTPESPVEEAGATIALPMPRLLVETPEGVVQEFQLKAQVTSIGRSPRNDICIPEASVSRQHAEVFLTAAGYTIRDLGSNNGVFVNDQKVLEHLLNSGDVIELGAPGWRLTFLAPE